MTCARDDCSRPVGRNGIACHEHFTTLVPAFLARALWTTRDAFTRDWLHAQVRHVVRGEAFTA